MKRLIEPAALFIPAYAVLLALSLKFGSDYVRLLLPLFRWEIGMLAPDFHILGMDLAKSRGEDVVALTLFTQDYLVGSRIIYPGTSISASTLAGQVLQHPILLLSLAFAWPSEKMAVRIVRLCCALPILLLIELIDIPFVLMGSVQDVIAADIGSGADTTLVGWMNFMNGGGRLALAIAGAIGAIGFSRLLKR